MHKDTHFFYIIENNFTFFAFFQFLRDEELNSGRVGKWQSGRVKEW